MSLLVFYIYTVVSDKAFSGSSTDPYCGGTILNEKTILTAAHCFGNQANKIKFKGGHISAGILLFEDAVWSIDNKKKQQHVKIRKVKLHPKYLGSDGIAHNFDAAIVKLRQSLTFNNRVKPACLPDPDFESEIAIISGWGNRKNMEGNGHTNYGRTFSSPISYVLNYPVFIPKFSFPLIVLPCLDPPS
jgi:hypothetical protein